MSDKPLVLGTHTLQSRLIVGTGKYATFDQMQQCLEASGSEQARWEVGVVEVAHEEDRDRAVGAGSRGGGGGRRGSGRGRSGGGGGGGGGGERGKDCTSIAAAAAAITAITAITTITAITAIIADSAAARAIASRDTIALAIT